MQIKKYEAIDMQEALRRVKTDLGPDAVILSSRKIRRGAGAFGMLGRPLVEVTAAVDYPARDPRPATRNPKPATPDTRSSAFPIEMFIREDIQQLKEELHALLQGYLEHKPSELSEIKGAIADLRHSLGTTAMDPDLVSSPEAVPLHGFSGTAREVYRRFLLKGIDEDLALRMAGTLNHLQPGSERQAAATPEGLDLEKVDRYAREILERQTRITGVIFRESERRKAVLFLGPTGGGKTTTLAKVAARYALTEKKKVVLVSLDTYRIAAVEQLKIYARILGTPMEVALSPPELRGIFRRHPEADLFLLDTAGRSQKDPSFVAELHAYFPGQSPPPGGGEVLMEGHLVLPATLRPDVLKDVVLRFSALPVNGLLFTKLDEVDGYGSIFNTMIRAQTPLSYFTMGQRVPEDIEQATPAKLAQLVMGQGG